MTSNSHAIEEWERRTIVELYREYTWTLKIQNLKIRPAQIALSDSEVRWGTWDKTTRTISISRKLVHNYNWFQVLGVLKHETAHQLIDEAYSHAASQEKSHGELFKWACKKVGVPQEFSGSSADLQVNNPDWRNQKGDDETERLLDKIRKLLALATSSNEHESLSAMNKVRELYAKHNIDQNTETATSRFSHLVISLGKKRIDIAQKKIVGILVGHFFVQAISFNLFDAATGERHKAVELIGTRENVLMAEYVYHFLIQQTDFLCREMTKSSSQKLTRVTRKSFILGTLQGFSDKLKSLEVSPDRDDVPSFVGQALVKFREDPALEAYMGEVYPKTVSRTSTAQYIDDSAYDAGMTAGKTITLNKAVSSTASNQGRLLEQK